MRRFAVAFVFLVATGSLLAQLAAQTPPPAAAPAPANLPLWAYGYAQPGTPIAPAAPAAADDGSPKTLAGSSGKFTLTEIRNGFGPADWYPSDHPTMPEIVARGRKDGNVRACALCHYPNGKGRAENAPVAGFPVEYFIQQMHDYRNGKRKSADPKKGNTNAMITIAKAMTEDEIKASAEYFGSMTWTPWIKVVETRTVPKTRIAGGLFISLPGSDTEPLGQRIIEVPEDNAREALRDPRSGFVAYVPIGSIKKGEALVRTGGGRTTACAVCHGADLKGLGPVPGLAGRSPSYSARQLFDMQVGARAGVWADLMKPVVAKLTEEDLINISAYTASLAP
ncbi:MAG TPA: c-type cytochrome [Vicinamibacterales bacterium]|nr:c-type cytochrome [Vicinamibacterales bacterium]